MNKKYLSILLIILFILFVILSSIFKNKSNNAIENSIKSLNEFKNNEDTKNSYLYFDYISKSNNNYMIVFNESTPYIVYLNNKLINKVNNYDLNKESIKIIGESKETTEEIKKHILEIYNEGTIIGDEDYLEIDNFDSVFGNYYLDGDKVLNDNDLYKNPSFLSSLFFDLGLLSLLILVFQLLFNSQKNNNI